MGRFNRSGVSHRRQSRMIPPRKNIRLSNFLPIDETHDILNITRRVSSESGCGLQNQRSNLRSISKHLRIPSVSRGVIERQAIRTLPEKRPLKQAQITRESPCRLRAWWSSRCFRCDSDGGMERKTVIKGKAEGTAARFDADSMCASSWRSREVGIVGRGRIRHWCLPGKFSSPNLSGVE